MVKTKYKEKNKKNNNHNKSIEAAPKEEKPRSETYLKIRGLDYIWVPVLLALISGIAVWLRAFSSKFDTLIGYDAFYFFREASYYAKEGLPIIDPMAPTVVRYFRIEDTQGLTWITGMIAKVFNLEVFTVYQYFGPAMGMVVGLLVFGLTYLWWKEKYLSLIAAFFSAIIPAVIYRTAGNFVEKDTLGIVWALLFLVLATLMLTTESKKLWILALAGIPLTMMAYANTFGNFFFMPISIGVYLFLRPLFEKESEKTIIHRIKANTNLYLLAVALLMSSVVYVLLGVPAYGVGSPDTLRVYLGGVALIGGLMADLLATVVKKRLYYLGVLAAVGAGTLAFAAVVLNYNVIGILLQSGLSSQGISGQGQLSGLKDFNDKFYIFWPISLIGAAYAFYKAWTSQEKKGTNNMFGPDPIPNIGNVLPLALYAVFMFLSFYMLRNTFYGGVFVAMLSAYSIYALYSIVRAKMSFRISMAIAMLGLIIMAPVGFMGGMDYAKSNAPHLNSKWVEGLDWLKANTPEDEVICNWWDYGYWIQAQAERKTISDGMRRNQGEWISGYARMLASTESDSLLELKRMEDGALSATGNEFKLRYIIVDPTLTIKTTVLNTVVGDDIFKTSQIGYRGKKDEGTTVTHTFESANVRVVLIQSKETGETLCYAEDASGQKYGIKNVIIEHPGYKNTVINAEYEGVPTINEMLYISQMGIGIFFPENLKDTMFARMIMYENTNAYEKVFDNGHIKIYKVK